LQTFSTTADSQNWAADGQLNVLLMGLGVQKGSSAGQLGPDTIMVLHVGINTGQAELISIGRNEYCVPLPTQEIAAHYPQTNFYSGTNCPAGTFPQGMWALPNEILGHCDRWPIPEYQSTCGQAGDPNRYPRAYKGTEMTIGNLLGMHIDGSMWINPAGLSTLIDALSGVDIKVTTTLSDGPCGYTGDANYNLGSESAFSAIGRPYCPDSTHTGYFVPTGLTGIQHMKDQADASNGGLTLIQVPGHPYDVAFIMKPGTYHMNGEWALAYARTRIYSSDSSRSARQQGVLAALRKDLDPCHFANVGNVLQVLGALQSIPQGFNTDLGIEDGSNLQAWAGLAKKVLSPTTQQQLVLTQSNTNQGAVQLSKDTTHPSWWPAFGPTSVQNAQQLVQQHFVTSTGSSGSGGSSC
jgi:anionic cell wall polymer biosynthesis LytR-Cps2A-Psr (LCP) family protein